MKENIYRTKQTGDGDIKYNYLKKKGGTSSIRRRRGKLLFFVGPVRAPEFLSVHQLKTPKYVFL